MKRRDERGGVAEGCQCATSACRRRVGATYHIVNDRTMLGHDAEHHDPNTAMTASKIAGEPDLIYFNNKIEPRAKITRIINEIIFCIIYKREGVAPGGLALLLVTNVFRRPFRPTRANRHALVDRAGCALSADAWQLARIGQKCRQNRLIMVRLLCHGESGSSMFCGCGVAIV